eukprot:m51a1_g9419 putative uv radiation resistance-associated gene protein (527) ;mRNA; r:366727-368891
MSKLGPRVLPRQLRLRHVRTVMARNLLVSAERDTAPDPYFTLEDSATESVVYTSEILRHTTNPTWRSIDRLDMPDSAAESCSRITLAVWDASEEPHRQIAKHAIVFCCLTYLFSDRAGLEKYDAPLNSVVLELLDGIYLCTDAPLPPTPPPQFSVVGAASAPDAAPVPAPPGGTTPVPVPAPASSSPPPPMHSLSTSVSLSQLLSAHQAQAAQLQQYKRMAGIRRAAAHAYDVDTLLELLEKKRQAEEEEARAEQLRARVEELLEHNAELFQKQTELEEASLGVERLKRELRQQEQQLEEIREPLREKQQALVMRAHALFDAQTELQRSADSLKGAKPLLDSLLEQLQQTRRSLSRMQWKLLAELRMIFPIVRVDDARNLYSICGITLKDSDFSGCNEEEVATALGNVAHLLCLSSRYLEIALRYPITPSGSRSVIRDDITPHASPTFPLYSRGVEPKRFAYGVFLLNKDVEQVLSAYAYLFPKDKPFTLRSTLFNLNAIFEHASKQSINPTVAPPSPVISGHDSS